MTLAQARPSSPTLVSPVRVTVPNTRFAQPGTGERNPTIETDNGRRWMSAEDLAHYLRNNDHPLISAADLVAFNAEKVQTLNGRQVFEVGRSLEVLPGAAAVERAMDPNAITVRGGVSAVIGGNTGGPFNVFALTPIDSQGVPQLAETKIFYSVPGTPIVGTFKPADASFGTGMGGSTNLRGLTLFGNVRLEVGDTREDGLTNTGFSVNGGILFPLPNLPGKYAGGAASASVMGWVDWQMVMDAYRMAF